MKKEFTFSLELCEDNALIISLLSRFADIERIADHVETGYNYSYNYPQYKVTNIKDMDAIKDVLKITALADWLRDHSDNITLWNE